MKKFSFKDYFLPHSGNDHKPHFWRKEVIVLLLVLIILSELAFLGQVFFISRKGDFLAAILPNAVVLITNQKREEVGARILVPNTLLQKAAELKAEDMAKKGYFSHTTPEGRNSWYWLEQVGYDYVYAGENLAVNFSDSSDLTEAWMNSPTHRENIVKPNFTEIGIGMATGTYKGRETVFVAQFFGSQREKPVKVAVPAVKPTPLATKKPVVATSTKEIATATPVQIASVKGESTEKSAVPLQASPRLSTSQFYTFLLAFIGGAFLLAVLVKIEIQHPSVLLGGFLLFALIFGLMTFNTFIFRLGLEIPESSASIVRSGL